MAETVSNPISNPDPQKRNQIIIQTSLFGIGLNLLLVLFKAVAGFFSQSIALILDAVNNLSDALSSIVTIAGIKLASKKPDKEHPLGHGRFEYVSAMVVSALVLYAGIAAMVESVKKIIHPVLPSYSAVSLIIMAVAICVKIFLGFFFQKKGDQTRSASLRASGTDAFYDGVLSASVLFSAIFYLTVQIPIEAYVGILISFMIIRSGIGMLIATINDILGSRSDSQITQKVKAILNASPDVHGAFDLVLYNYGPDRNYGSVRLELPDTMSVSDVDRLSRQLEDEVYAKTGVILTGIGVYSYNTAEPEVDTIREQVFRTVLSHDWALQAHGFTMDLEHKTMRFDVVISFDMDQNEGLRILESELHAIYPDYRIQIVADMDITD